MHLEPMKGTLAQNRKYCSKASPLTELGDAPKQGERTDLAAAMEDIKANVPRLDCMEKYPQVHCKYIRFCDAYRGECEYAARKADREVTVYLFHGATGTGKTRTAMLKKPFKIQASELKWFDSYKGKTTLLIDEYNNDCSITTLLKLTDRYECRLAIKDGFTHANWTTVYITTTLTPDELHPQAKQVHRDSLFRRINEIIHFT